MHHRRVLSLVGVLITVLLAGCSVAPDIDPQRLEADVRADPHVAAVDIHYSAGNFTQRGLLILMIDLRPRLTADQVVGAVSRASELLRAGEFDEVTWQLTVRSAGDAGSLRIGNGIDGGPPAPVVEAETRRWTAIAGRYPGTFVDLGGGRDGLRSRTTELGVPDHGSVVAAFDAAAAIPGAAAHNSVQVDVRSPDPGRTSSYSSDGTAPPEEVVRTMAALSAVADPPPDGLGVESEATASLSASPPVVTAFVDLSPAEYHRVPVNQINALLPGTRTDRIAREYEQVLDGSGLRFRLQVQVNGGAPYIARDTR